MIKLKRFIHPGLAISVLGHVGIVVLGLLFAAASGLMSPPPEPTATILPDATVVEIVPPNEAPRFEGTTASETRSSGSESPLKSANASAAPQPSRKPTAQQQQQQPQQQAQPQPQPQPQPQQQPQQRPAKNPQPNTRAAKAPPPPTQAETAHDETAPPDPAQTETAEPDTAAPDTAQPDVKQTSAPPPPPPAPSPSEETADQPPAAETFAQLALLGGQLGGGFAAPAVNTNKASDDFTVAFRERVSSCSSLPAGIDRRDNIEVSLRVSFNPDGTLASPPRPLRPITSPKAQAIMDSSIDALQKCQPYTMLPAAKYKQWKTLDLTFYPLNFGG